MTVRLAKARLVRRLAPGVVAAWLFGCSSAPPSLEGRWLDQKNDSFLEFSASGLCAEVEKSPENVLVHRYQFAGNRLKLTLLSSGWKLDRPAENARPGREEERPAELTAKSLRLQTGKNLVHSYTRVPEEPRPFPLKGLWSSTRPDHRVDYYEFTPGGDLISLVWYPPLTKNTARHNLQTPLRLAGWHGCHYDGKQIEASGYTYWPSSRQFSSRVEFVQDTLKFVDHGKVTAFLVRAKSVE